MDQVTSSILEAREVLRKQFETIADRTKFLMILLRIWKNKLRRHHLHIKSLNRV